MDVIGNNIANVNTAGYKTSRVIFQDIFSQNVAAGMSNQGPIGGTNPRQIGLGIRLSTVDVIHSRAAFQRTDKETDMMINGDGFFIVAQQNMETGQWDYVYTRAGNFDIDNEGYLVTSGGLYVMGRTFELTMGVVDPGRPEVERRVMIPAGFYSDTNPIPMNAFRVGDVIPMGTLVGQTAEITITEANINQYNGGIPGVPAIPPDPDIPGDPGTPAVDPIPNSVLITGQTWPPIARPAIAYSPARDPIFGLIPSEGYIGFDPVNSPPDAYGLTRIRLVANQLVLPLDPNSGLPTGYPPRPDGISNEAYTEILDDWLAELTDMQDVSLPGFAVADNGDVSVIVGNRKLVVGQIALAMFANASGLEKAGNSLYRESASSGPVVVTEAFMDGAGKIDGGGLEMSNVDLADQFTDMIVTQRGFQANSRIITVSDTMLEELVNLKR